MIARASIMLFLRKLLVNTLFVSYSKGSLKRNIAFAFKLHGFLSTIINDLSVRYYDGRHPKHVLWKSHYKFIVDNIRKGDTVLDVGTGASLSYTQSIASKALRVDCVDIDPAKIDASEKGNVCHNVHYSILDITQSVPSVHYDVVILSHVLEHLDDPDSVLQNIRNISNKVIVRLPRYDDHWHYLLKKELGLFYFKDHDHRREYTIAEACELLTKNGWTVDVALNDVDIKMIATLPVPG